MLHLFSSRGYLHHLVVSPNRSPQNQPAVIVAYFPKTAQDFTVCSSTQSHLNTTQIMLIGLYLLALRSQSHPRTIKITTTFRRLFHLIRPHYFPMRIFVSWNRFQKVRKLLISFRHIPCSNRLQLTKYKIIFHPIK